MQMDVVERRRIAGLNEFYARTPRIENKAVQADAGVIAVEAAVFETLQAYAGPADTHVLQRLHLLSDIRVSKTDVVDGSTLAAAKGLPGYEFDSHTAAIQALRALRDCLAGQMGLIPFLRRVSLRYRQFYVLYPCQSGCFRLGGGSQDCAETSLCK